MDSYFFYSTYVNLFTILDVCEDCKYFLYLGVGEVCKNINVEVMELARILINPPFVTRNNINGLVFSK